MLLDKMRKTITKYSLLEKGDNVICAVSGGADSVCLLHTMLLVKEEYGINVYVANVNHLIRGEESDADSLFVKELCKKYGVEFFYREYDVKKIASENKTGEEECGRILRYEFFEELSEKLGGAKIATAHNLNDNAETVIFRLARGTSARGISGIMHKRGNIIRPLLDISRDEIEDYLKKNRYSWCEDSTNKIPVYTRNKIRLSVMPLLNEISSDADRKIVSAAKLIAEDNEYINSCAESLFGECFADNSLNLCCFEKTPLPIRRRITSFVFEKWGMRDITADKVEKFIEFTKKDNGKKFDINSDFYACKSYENIVLCSRKESQCLREILSPGNEVLKDGWKLSAVITEEKPKIKSNNKSVFDADKLPETPEVTYRKQGDKIALKGLSGSKKLSDIFTDEKISREKRDEIPVVRCGGEIIYVAGLRQSRMYEIDENTKKYLIIEYKGREE